MSTADGVAQRASTRLARARRVLARPRVGKLLRYAVTSGVATGVSEVTLLALYASGFLGASGSAIVANLAGSVPSYLLSRYWIWPDAERSGAARQMGLYWVTSAVSLVLSTAATSLAAAHSPAGHGVHVIVVGAAYIAAYAVLWVAKFLVYQRLIFRTPRADAGIRPG
ncbi:MAG: GtrA family protein [Candidatus Dormiibacterota bacterium]